MNRLLTCTSGQSTVELVALLPLLVAVGLGALHVLAAGSAAEAAGAAAEAGAVALLQDRDPRDAAHETLSGWPSDATRIRVHGRRITVIVRPGGIPPLARRLTATSTAYAGPPPVPPRTAATAARGGDGLHSRPQPALEARR